jgi:hypothetical protein
VTQVGQPTPQTRLPHRQPHGIVGRLSGPKGRRSDWDFGMGEDAPCGGLTALGQKAEQHPGWVFGGTGQRCVAGKLGLEPGEAFRSPVVFKEEGKALSALYPDAIAIGNDRLSPGGSTASLRPPLDQFDVVPQPGPAHERGKEAVAADEVGELATGGKILACIAMPVQLCDLDAALGCYHPGANPTEDEVVETAPRPETRTKSIHQLSGVEDGESLLSPPQGSETDVGNLGSGQCLMVVEESTDYPVPFGDPAGKLVEPIISTRSQRTIMPSTF